MKLFFGTGSIVLFISAKAQTILHQFPHYTTKDGVPSSEVYDAIQDSKGYMWFATDRGIARFNGYEFHTYTTNNVLTDNTVFSKYPDSLFVIFK